MKNQAARKAIFLLGEILLTFSALILLYVGYQMVYTNFESEQKSTQLAAEFKQNIFNSNSDSTISSETQIAVPREFKKATVLGLIYIPKLKADVWGEPIVSGTGYSELAQGIGHYLSNPLPSQPGNFAIAGHRVTYGQPFYYFERLRKGDQVFVLMPEGWYSYELIADQKIQESETWVLGDVRAKLGVGSETKLITLTTCDPRWNSTRRWAFWGIQTGFYPLDQTPPEIGEL